MAWAIRVGPAQRQKRVSPGQAYSFPGIEKLRNFPEGDIRPRDQGCCIQLPWERDSQRPNPNGGCVRLRIETAGCVRGVAYRNPVGVGLVARGLPKVAEYSNLGLRVATTSWSKPLLRKAPKAVF